MSKDRPSQPQPVVVNPGATASQQAVYNRDAALEQRALNMVDQYTPDGSVKYEPTETERVKGIPDFSVTQTLSPAQQGLHDLSNQAATKYGEIGNTQLDKVRASFEEPFSLASLGAAPTVNEDTRTATRDAMLARLQPQMDRDRGALQTSLINQGFTVGSEGYDSALDEANRAENDLYLGADVAAGNEMSRMYGLESSARDKSINEMAMERNVPLSELAAFMSGSQPNSPTFVPTPQTAVAAPDFMGAAYGSANMQNAFNQNTYNQQSANSRANTAGLYGLGGAGLGAAGMTYGGPGWRWGR